MNHTASGEPNPGAGAGRDGEGASPMGAHYHSLFEQAAEGFFQTTPEGYFLLANPALARINGYESPAEMMACLTNLAEQHYVNPEDRARFLREIQRRGSLQGFETEVYRKDRTRTWISITAHVVRDATGRVRCFEGSVQDISARKRAEAALAASEKRLRLTWESSLDGMRLADGDGRVVMVNNAFCRLVQKPREDLEGRMMSVPYPADRAEEILGKHRRRFADRSLPPHQETDVVLWNGRRLVLELSNSFLEIPGEPALLLSVYRDVTARKQGEILLQLQHDLTSVLSRTADLELVLAKILELMGRIHGVEGGGVYLENPDGTGFQLAAHRGVSPEFVARVAFYPAASAGRKLVQGQPPLYAFPEALRQRLEPLLAEEGILGLAVVPLQHEGRLVGVLNLASRCYAEMPQASRPLIEAIASQAASVIVRIQAEQRLAASEQRFRQVVEQVREVFWMRDLGMEQLLYISPAYETIWGRSCASAYANPRSWQECIHPDDRVRIAAMTTPDQISRQYDVEYRIVRPDGALRWIRDRAFPVRNARGEVVRVAGFAEDVTQYKHMERQILEISDREQARVGQDLHDGLCQQLVSAAFDINRLVQRLATRAPPETGLAERIAALIDQSITESRRLARGLYPVKLETEGLAAALEELAAATRARAAIACETRCSSQLRLANHAAATHLYRIAQEAVNNAVKHSGARHVTVHLNASARELRLEIRDDGRGMPPNPGAATSMGMHIMSYRARSLGSVMAIGPAPGGGTVVSCCVPLDRL
ncbi:MAG: PAS domain S-box protein [Verrucomicrobia bacterium]|nr:PAS domain S-box protein [Verrucomicrobiota bacterium]